MLPEDWPWSSYPFVISDQFAPEWLDNDWLLGQFGTQHAVARRAYKKFVSQGHGLPSPLLATKHQLFFGDEDFVKQFQAELQECNLRELSIAHKRSLALSLEEYAVTKGVSIALFSQPILFKEKYPLVHASS